MRTSRRRGLRAWSFVNHRWVVGSVLFLAPGLSGCPGVTVPPGGDITDFTDGNRDESAVSPLGKTSGEPNDDFAEPVAAVFDSSDVARLKGTIATRDDLDVFLLGPLNAGDRVIIDALAAGDGRLDVSIALFDGDERIVFNNDDRSGSNLDARIDFVLRHSSERYYLVAARSAFSATARETGQYTADIRVSHDASVPLPESSVLLLDFDGGTVDSPSLGTMTLPAFDAGDIHRAYAGTTATMKRIILEVMEQNYERFDVTILTSDDPAPPAGAAFSRIVFGGFNDLAFGISESVDLYNADCCDDAIIFTESFSPFLFSLTPTTEEMGLAIGNIAAHEAGHLLGLNHVDDDFDIMDDRSPADAFLLDQEFKESPLSTDIMPIGAQDGVLMLFEIVGLGDELPSTIQRSRMRLSPVDPRRLAGVEIVRRQAYRAAPR